MHRERVFQEEGHRDRWRSPLIRARRDVLSGAQELAAALGSPSRDRAVWIGDHLVERPAWRIRVSRDDQPALATAWRACAVRMARRSCAVAATARTSSWDKARHCIRSGPGGCGHAASFTQGPTPPSLCGVIRMMNPGAWNCGGGKTASGPM